VRVLVTRPRDQAKRTAAALRVLGHEVLIAPLLEIRPTGAAPPEGSFAATILTSANAVPALAAHARRGLAPERTFAVGERTAASARDAGLPNVQTTADEGGGAALARQVMAAVEPGAALLLVAGRERKAEPLASLTAAGFRVAVWETYAAHAVAELPPSVREALRSGDLDAALHYSRRSAETALRLAEGAALLAPFLRLHQHALSEDVAEPLGRAGAGRVTVAARPDEASLLAGLPDPYSRPPPRRC
jgi:uroporphyrinogen-III synthase